MWAILMLKMQEAEFFHEQVRGHSRFPRQFLFFLSAFLASTRGVMAHLREYLEADDDPRNSTAWEELLSDPVSQFFGRKHEEVAQQGIPVLQVEQLDVARNLWGQTVVSPLATGNVPADGVEVFIQVIEQAGRQEWPSGGAPRCCRYRWTFPDHPAGRQEIVAACEEYVKQLWWFLADVDRRRKGEDESPEPPDQGSR